MGYDGERSIIENPIMLTEYEISVLLKWHSERTNNTSFEDQLAERIRSAAPVKTEEDVW